MSRDLPRVTRRRLSFFDFRRRLAAFFVSTAASRPGPIRAIDHLHHLDNGRPVHSKPQLLDRNLAIS